MIPDTRQRLEAAFKDLSGLLVRQTQQPAAGQPAAAQ
jgi:hypothetical protein